MTRVLDALKALEERRAAESAAAPRAVETAAHAHAAPQPRSSEPKPTQQETAPSPPPLRPERVHPATESVRRAAKEHAVANMCLLPTVPVVAEPYHELAERISEQLSTNYCNVMLFVSPDAMAEPGFSMTHLAQAFSLQSTGDVLLVDGDLRNGRLSKTVCPTGPGMIEAMAGAAHWPQIIHSTTTPRIDFVSRGEGEISSREPAKFGWGALRPKYRAVLIGIADQRLPETAALAAHCDAVYVLISRPHTKRQAAADAVEALRANGAHLMGCVVVND
ncbi:MAG: hypothetical protein WD845_18725 [Pirellulales bacterium]